MVDEVLLVELLTSIQLFSDAKGGEFNNYVLIAGLSGPEVTNF